MYRDSEHFRTEITREMKKFVREDVFNYDHYLFFSKNEKNNDIKVYCSRCNNEFGANVLKHNEIGNCPVCETKVQAKELRYGRKMLTKEACFYYFEKSLVDPSVIVAKGYYSKKYYEEYNNPQYTYELQAIYLFDMKSNKSKMLRGKGLYETKTIFDFNIDGLKRYRCHCSFASIRQAIKETPFEYMPLDKFIGRYSMVKLFELYTKYPWIEYLCKMGFENIVEQKLLGQSIQRCLNYKGKTVFEILRLPKRELKILRESGIEITPEYLKLYQIQVKDRSNLTPGEVKQALSDYGFYMQTFEFVSKHSQLKRTIKYLDKQLKIGNDIKSNTIITYSDYLENCLKLNLDMKQKEVLYPKNLKKAHDDTIKQVKVVGDLRSDELIKKRLEVLNKKYRYESNGLIIRPAESTEELIKEGSALKHCVASNYTKKYADGKTIILLVRNTEEENKPLVTVEVNRGKIIQNKGKGNTEPKPNVVEFLNKFKEERLVKVR